MRLALETATAQIYFELDRFELSGDEQSAELTGRWFGVRGRRFVRPTLTVAAGGDRHRLLADMAHKPWAPEEGADWVAAFPWGIEGKPVTDLELSVAPDIALELPQPGAAPQRVEMRPARPRRRPPDESSRLLQAERRETERLRGELVAAREAGVQADAAMARRDAAVEKASQLEAERGAAVAERDVALQTRDAAIRERDSALAARDAALAHSEQLSRATAELQAQLGQASAAAERALSERRQTVLELEHAQASAAARSALATNRPVTRRHWLASAGARETNWAGRLLALAVLIGALVALVLIAHLL